MMVVLLVIISLSCLNFVAAARDNGQLNDITPVPMDLLNPRLTEFRRMDTNNDNALTFGEFLLSDRPFVESQSRYFHELDQNGDGRVSREEFERYFKQMDDEHHRQRIQTDKFFKDLALSPFDAVTINRSLLGFGLNPLNGHQQIIIKSGSGPPSQQPIQPQQPTQQQTQT